MLASELRDILDDVIKRNGDSVIEDSDGFPIEEVSILKDEFMDEGHSFMIYSEGDEH